MKGSEPIDWYADVLDSRDVIDRLTYLESQEIDELDEDEREELDELTAFCSECEGYAADWHYGEALIADRYFKEYAMELADDIGAIDPNANWPLNCIDWDQAARELQMDYISVEIQGKTFWIR